MAQAQVVDELAFYRERWTSGAEQLPATAIRRQGVVLDALADVWPALNRASRPIAICDLGCGRGWLSGALSAFGSVTGTDLYPDGLEVARQRYPQVTFIEADGCRWRPDLRFDLVVSSEVIEHVPDQAAFAGTCAHLLRPGGFLILTTPNARTKRAFFADGLKGQPREDWLRPRDLKRLFRRDFDLLRHDTFHLDFAYTGLFRLTSAPRLLGAVRRAGLSPAYDGLRKQLALGNYQLLVARRR